MFLWQMIFNVPNFTNAITDYISLRVQEICLPDESCSFVSLLCKIATTSLKKKDKFNINNNIFIYIYIE